MTSLYYSLSYSLVFPGPNRSEDASSLLLASEENKRFFSGVSNEVVHVNSRAYTFKKSVFYISFGNILKLDLNINSELTDLLSWFNLEAKFVDLQRTVAIVTKIGSCVSGLNRREPVYIAPLLDTTSRQSPWYEAPSSSSPPPPVRKRPSPSSLLL